MKDKLFILYDRDSKKVHCASPSFQRITVLQKSLNSLSDKSHMFSVTEVDVL